MEQKRPLISVIVPVYNVEPFLRKCLDSLVNQTYENLEIILVDDGSPDNSGLICDEYKEKYPQIVVIHQENRGLCGARNTGLRVAKGEYIGFVDSDDWCSLDMYEYLLKKIISYEADVVACRYYRVKPGKATKSVCNGMDRVMNHDEAIIDICKHFVFRTTFWNKLFKKELFEGLQFPEGYTFEGTRFMHKVLDRSQKAVLLGDPKYYYLDNENSIVRSKNISTPLNYASSYISRYKDLKESYPEIEERLFKDAVKNVLKLVYSYKKINKESIELNKELFEYITNFIVENRDRIRIVFGRKKALILNNMSKMTPEGYKKAHHLNGVFNRLKKLKSIFKLSKKKKKKKDSHIVEMTPERQEKLIHLQKVLIEILVVIDDICRKNNINYFLYGGTLLGSVRDGRIIPWDDDMDIVMYREDYEKFKEVCKTQLPSNYFYQDCFTDPEYPHLICKIRKNDTYVCEKKWDKRNMHKGIFVDILPLDYFPNNSFLGSITLHWMSFLHQVCCFEKCSSKKLYAKVLFKIAKLIPTKTLYSIRRKSLLFINNHSSHENVCSFGSHYQPMIRRVLKKEWFGEPIEMNLEGISFMAPENWEGYLLHLFGENYRELPPEDKRVCHGDLDSIKF